jgi:hypothetical protein
VYRDPASHTGDSVVLDVVDGPALVRRAGQSAQPKPTLCARPCKLELPRGEHALSLLFVDEHGEASINEVMTRVTGEPTVHRVALARYITRHRGLAVTAQILGIAGGALLSGGLPLLAFGNHDRRTIGGVFAGMGAGLVGFGFTFRAFAGENVKRSELVFSSLKVLPTATGPSTTASP